MTAPAFTIPAPGRRRSPDGVARRREERELVLRYHRAGDRGAREALVHRFLPLARHLALRYRRGGEPIDDLFQVASLGLLKAIDRFDPDRHTTLSSFAVPTIVGELKRHFRDHGWAVHVPRDLQQRSAHAERATEALLRELGRRPTPAELAARTNATIEQVQDARQASAARRPLSLDQSPDGPPDLREGALQVEEPGYGRAEQRATIAKLLPVLDEREREILRLRFADDLLQSEIAERVGVSQVHVSRLIRRSLTRLREAAGAGEDRGEVRPAQSVEVLANASGCMDAPVGKPIVIIGPGKLEPSWRTCPRSA